MDINQVIAADHAHYMPVFGQRVPIMFTHGKGVTLYGSEGKAYTDFLAGIATNALGYAHPGFTAAIQEQAGKLLHCSNYFYIEEQTTLASLFCELTCADRAFFASTGAEANECAIKLARKHFRAKGEDRYEIISANNSFHGRTMATLAATGQEAYRKDYTPLPPGFINVEYGSLEAVKAALSPRSAAVMVEPIQGEGGVIEGGAEYLKALRSLCDREGILLIFDEVQTGMGRTGKLFAHQLYGVEPDIFTSAKALGNGIPISACLCKESCNAFLPGDHGSTLGGNPFCCSAGLYSLRTISDPAFLRHVREMGDYLKSGLSDLKLRKPEAIAELRGQGLMLGATLTEPYQAQQVKSAMIEKGFLIGTAGGNTLRFVPPLIIEPQHVDAMLVALEEVLR